MVKQGELRTQVESAFADLPPAEQVAAADEIAVTWPIATYLVSDGFVTIHHALHGTRCVAGRLLDVAGTGVTGASGSARISLNAFHCLDSPATAGGNALGYNHPINVVATGRDSGRSITITVQAEIGQGTNNRPEDVFLTFSAWNPDGSSLGGARFNWRCVVPISSIVG